LCGIFVPLWLPVKVPAIAEGQATKPPPHLEGAVDPVWCRRALLQPVGDVANDIGTGQSLPPGRLEEVQIHADQHGDPANLRFEHLVGDIAVGGPFRLGDIGM
jgi:hypothetical protein